MSERELFEEWIKKEHPHIYSGSLKDSEDSVRFKMDVDFMFSAWQASANRQGYKLVPVEATDAQWEAAIDAYTIAMDGKDILSASAFYDIYEAMLGAVE